MNSTHPILRLMTERDRAALVADPSLARDAAAWLRASGAPTAARLLEEIAEEIEGEGWR